MRKIVGLIGYGVIGKYVYRRITEENHAEVGFVFDTNPEATAELPYGLAVHTKEALDMYLSKNRVDLVCEMATYQAVRNLAPIVLRYTDMCIFSLTSFADAEFGEEIERLCSAHERNVYIPHGAVLGLDGIQDGREVLQSVGITTIKRPENLGCTENVRTVLFEGSTREACERYPRNINVHAGVALAGLGFDRTSSAIIADPDIPGNTHVIEIKAEGVTFRIEVCSDPVGKVTGAYTPVSAYNSILRILNRTGLIII